MIIRGMSGFINMGNTCYLNSVLQCLFGTKSLLIYLLSKEYQKPLLKNIREKDENRDIRNVLYIKNIINQTLTQNLYEIMYAKVRSNESIKPRALKNVISKLNRTFVGNNQHDAHELLIFMINQMNEELGRKVDIRYKNIPESVINFSNRMTELINNNDENTILMLENEYPSESLIYKYKQYLENDYQQKYSQIDRIFLTTLYSEIKCLECMGSSIRFESYQILQIPIPKKNNITIQDCLDLFFEKEILTGDNKYYCQRCQKHVDAIKRYRIWKLAETLVISFVRYEITNDGRRKKINSLIDYPIRDLSLDKYYSAFSKSNKKYDLYGVVRQMGSLDAGHYTSVVKHITNDNWYLYNDCNNEQISENDIVTDSSYILFYENKI